MIPQRKIKPTLNLKVRGRQDSFESELAAMRLPAAAERLVDLLLQNRQKGLESKYDVVFLFFQLERKGGDYWTKYNCKSVDELLTRFDLPVASTLNKWLHIVQLFPRDTVLTLGEDSIFLMLRAVLTVQPVREKQREDFGNILAEYSRTHDDFNKAAFEDVVWCYVNTTYYKAAGLKIVDNTMPPPRDAPSGTRSHVSAKSLEGTSQAALHHTSELVVESRRDGTVSLALQHIAKLEAIIKKELGAKHVPPRPAGL